MRARVLGITLALAVVAALGVTPGPAAAQGFTQVAFNTSTTDVTLVTTAETVIVSSGPATAPRQTTGVCVLAWAQLTTGTNTTSVTPRIRRGTSTSGTLVSGADLITIGAAAGSNEQYYAMACEERANVASVEYSFTLSQAGASANGTALQAGIIVFAR